MASPAFTGQHGVGFYGPSGSDWQWAETSSFTTATGKGVIVQVSWQEANNVLPTLSDNKSNSAPTFIGTRTDLTAAGTNAHVSFWYYPALTTGGTGHTFKCDWGSPGQYPEPFPTILAAAFDVEVLLDATTIQIQAPPFPLNVTTLTTGAADTLVVAGVMLNGSAGYSLSATGYTPLAAYGNGAYWAAAFLSKPVAASGASETPAIAYSGTDPDNSAARMMSFKAVGGDSGATTATPAAGVATVSAAGASRAASAATAAAGVATVSAAGAAGSATTATAAAGAATVSGAGASSAATTATPAAGSATVSATTDSGTVSATDAIPAAGSATVSASGSSTAETTATPAAGFATVSGNTSDIDYEAMAAAVWAYTLPNGKTAAETAVETLTLLEALAAEPGCLDVPIEGIYTGADLLRVIAAVQAGKTTITPTAPDEATVAFRAIDDSTTRVTATMDGSERTDVDIDAAD